MYLISDRVLPWLPCFPYYNPGYYLKKNYFGVGTIKGKGLFKGGIIF